MKEKYDFFDQLQEMPITFLPTYKYQDGTDSFDMTKKRTPSWCDRILWYLNGKFLSTKSITNKRNIDMNKDIRMTPLSYYSQDTLDLEKQEVVYPSDHRPVIAHFKITNKSKTKKINFSFRR